MAASHHKPRRIVAEVEHCLRLLYGAEQPAQLLTASNLVEVAQAFSAADAFRLSGDHDWIKRVLEDVKCAEGALPKSVESSVLHADDSVRYII